MKEHECKKTFKTFICDNLKGEGYNKAEDESKSTYIMIIYDSSDIDKKDAQSISHEDGYKFAPVPLLQDGWATRTSIKDIICQAVKSLDDDGLLDESELNEMD